MKIQLLLLIAAFSVLLCSCTSSKKEDAGDMTVQEPAASPSIARGTAKATAQVLGYDEEDTHYVCTLKIQQIDEYGAGAPPLPVGTEIEVVMPKALFGEDGDGSKAASMLATDRTVSVTLSHRDVPAVDGRPAYPWRAVEIH